MYYFLQIRLCGLRLILYIIDSLSFKMTKFQKYYLSLSYKTHTHTKVYTQGHISPILSLSHVCVGMCITLDFSWYLTKCDLSPMIMTLLSACLLFSSFGIQSLQTPCGVLPVLHLHLFHLPKTIDNWLHCPQLWLRDSKNRYVTFSV